MQSQFSLEGRLEGQNQEPQGQSPEPQRTATKEKDWMQSQELETRSWLDFRTATDHWLWFVLYFPPLGLSYTCPPSHEGYGGSSQGTCSVHGIHSVDPESPQSHLNLVYMRSQTSSLSLITKPKHDMILGRVLGRVNVFSTWENVNSFWPEDRLW